MKRNISLLLLACTMLLWVMSPALPAPAFGTAFSYQGKVTGASGAPVSGLADFRFTLWDSLAGGAQIGATVPYDDVNVLGGLFTVSLDFGSAAFQGASCWLQTDFRMAGQPTFSTLTPRVPIMANPYSICALTALSTPTATNADMLDGQHGAYYLNASNLSAGTLSDLRFSPNVVLLDNTQTITGAKTFSNAGNSFTGNGAGLTALNASNLSTGTIADGRLSSNVALLNATQTFTANKFFTGNVGIGVTAPASRLDVSGNSASYPTIKAVNTLASNDTPAILGQHNTTDYYGTGVKGIGGYAGVMGEVSPTGNLSYAGVVGNCLGGSGTNIGVRGTGSGSTESNYGVYGRGAGGQIAYGIYATASGATSNYAGYFQGNVYISGNYTASGSKTFRIDHPLDPANRYLVHYCTEGPEMLNTYTGNAVSGADGYAVVKLPDYFEAANRDCRYQLTVVDNSDDFVQAKVTSEVRDNQFTIRTSKPNIKVSWQVIGVRNDPWAAANPAQPELDKLAGERGTYIHPEVYGKSAEFSVDHRMTEQITADKTDPQR